MSYVRAQLVAWARNHSWLDLRRSVPRGAGVSAQHTFGRFLRHTGVSAGCGLVFPTGLVRSARQPVANSNITTKHNYLSLQGRIELNLVLPLRPTAATTVRGLCLDCELHAQ